MRTIIILLICLLTPSIKTHAGILFDKLSQIKQIDSITLLKNDQGFLEKYSMFFSQPVDYNNPNEGEFKQRIFVCHRGFDKPTLLVTEGYFADFALDQNYTEELSEILQSNIIVCEHRFFSVSRPQNCNWNCLTVENSAGDYHRIISEFKKIYTGKWISSGISKGGQTTMFYRAFYPQDVDLSVCYVSPLNKKSIDGRHEKFIKNEAGTPELRQKVSEYQLELFKRKKELLPYFDSLCKINNYKFRLSTNKIFDYWILDYSFGFWQWYNDKSQIVDIKNMNNKELAEYQFKENSPEFFQCTTPFMPFNYQSARELGYYGFRTREFKKYMSEKSIKNYVSRIMLPEELSNVKFSKDIYKKTSKFLRTTNCNMIFIYGEYDPWSASGVFDKIDFSKKDNIKIYIQPHGSHSSRINNMPPNIKTEIIDTIKKDLQ